MMVCTGNRSVETLCIVKSQCRPPSNFKGIMQSSIHFEGCSCLQRTENSRNAAAVVFCCLKEKIQPHPPQYPRCWHKELFLSSMLSKLEQKQSGSYPLIRVKFALMDETVECPARKRVAEEGPTGGGVGKYLAYMLRTANSAYKITRKPIMKRAAKPALLFSNCAKASPNADFPVAVFLLRVLKNKTAAKMKMPALPRTPKCPQVSTKILNAFQYFCKRSKYIIAYLGKHNESQGPSLTHCHPLSIECPDTVSSMYC